MALFLTLLGFLVGVFLIFAFNFVLADVTDVQRKKARDRANALYRERQKELARVSMVYKEVYQQAAEGLELRTTLREKLVQLVNESGVLIRPSQLAVACLGLALLGFLPVGILLQRWLLGLLTAVLLAPLPLAYVAFCRRRRRDRLLAQLPSAFDLMSRAMRAGQTITQSFLAVTDELPPPICEEFGYCYDQQNLGLSPEAAMRDLARRTGLLELRIFVLAVTVHRQTGGNMTTLLDKLGRVIRDRAKIRGSIKGMTAEGRMQALILMGLPPLMLAMMTVVNRPYVVVLFDHAWLLAATGVSMALGWYWMRRIINFDF